MIADEIRVRLEREPFERFFIRASSGKKYPVTAPGLVMFLKSSVFVAEANSDR